MTTVLDVKGLYCPQPLLRARKALLAVPAGDSLVVLSTDPSAAIDFTVYCDRVGLELVRVDKEPGLLTIEVKKPPHWGVRG